MPTTHTHARPAGETDAPRGARVSRPVATVGLIALLGATSLATTAAAQYPVRPTPVLDVASLPSDPVLGGLLTLRHTQEGDSTTDAIRNARFTVQMRLTPLLAMKLQAELAGIGRVDGDSTVKAFMVTDAFLQLTPRDTMPLAGRLRPALLVGRFKTPFSLEYLSPVGKLLTATRSVIVNELAPKRDIGALGQLDVDRRAVLVMGVMSGEEATIRTDGERRYLTVARLILLPIGNLSIAGKVGAQGDDRMAGYDARWVEGPLIVEGEVLQRRRPDGETLTDASGGFATVAYRLAPWLQAVARWEQYDQSRPTPFLSTWVTGGVNVSNVKETLRAQLNVVRKHDRPTDRRATELIAQLVAYF